MLISQKDKVGEEGWGDGVSRGSVLFSHGFQTYYRTPGAQCVPNKTKLREWPLPWQVTREVRLLDPKG